VLNGVADATQAPLEAPVVLVVQRLEREKHTADALAAWIASGLSHEGWELWVIGHGSERHLLEEMASRGACSGVRFLGQRSDVAELHKAAAMLLAPAPTEPFGLSVAEAMAAGLPVVAAGGGGHLETVGAVFPDLLFPPHDVWACAELLRRLAHLDRAGRHAIGEALRQFQHEKLGLERHADELMAVYERVAGEPRPSRRRTRHLNSATARSAGGERPQQLGAQRDRRSSRLGRGRQQIQ